MAYVLIGGTAVGTVLTLAFLPALYAIWFRVSHVERNHTDIGSNVRGPAADPSVAQAMANTTLRLSSGRTDMWRAWIGSNFSHSLGVLLVAGLALWAGFRIKTLPFGIIPTLTLIGCVYLVLALRYWFRTPAIGVAIGTGCFAAAWVLSLR